MTKHTPFHQSHKNLGAKTGDFAGYDMPLYYPDGAIAEHKWVRSRLLDDHHGDKGAGLFDVSHMGQVMVSGKDAVMFLQTLTPSFYEDMPAGRAKYTVLLNEHGGILDDLIVTKFDEGSFFLVVNAGRKDQDLQWIRGQAKSYDDVVIDYIEDRALVALQGEGASRILNDVLGFDASSQPYMFMLRHQDLFISRLGYTGEDGFEISIPVTQATALWDDLISHDFVRPVGLAARDTLRLEMGYPLYGHDIDETTTPIEASVGWVVSKSNTTCFANVKLQQQKQDGTDRTRVGIKILEKGIAREGAELVDKNEEAIGILTSGGFSPVLDCGVGQGYVKTSALHAGSGKGHEIFVKVRSRLLRAEIAPLSFLSAGTKSAKII